VGLTARVIEAAGIPTLCMSSAWDITFAVRPPRAVFVDFPLNHQTGKAHDPVLQRRILLDAFAAFERLWAPGQMVSLPYVWDPADRSWEERDFGPDFEPYGVGRSMQGDFAERVLGRAREAEGPATRRPG
jgi:hypothetical protein